MIRVSESMVDPRWLKQLVKSVETYSGVKKQLKFFRRDGASSMVYLPRYFAQEKLQLDLSINKNYACPPFGRVFNRMPDAKGVQALGFDFVSKSHIF